MYVELISFLSWENVSAFFLKAQHLMEYQLGLFQFGFKIEPGKNKITYPCGQTSQCVNPLVLIKNKKYCH